MIIKKVVEIVSIISIICLIAAFPAAIPTQAAALINVTDTLSDYLAGHTADHVIVFKTSSDSPKNGKILVDFPPGFNALGVPSAGVTVTINGASATFSVGATAQRVTLNKTGNDPVPSGSSFNIRLNGIINTTTPGSYRITITTTEPNGTTPIDGPTDSAAFSIVFGGTPTTTTVISSINPSIYGQQVTFTATVVPSDATGTVTFKDGSNVLASNLPLSSGTVSCYTTSLSAGPHNITAEYGGDIEHDSSISPALTQTVNPISLTVSGITAINKVYDGTTAAQLNTASASLIGILAGDTVTLNTAGGAGSFSNENVGTSKLVTISGLSLAGSSAPNYTLTQPTSAANISPRSLNVTATGVNKIYDGLSSTTVTLADNRIAGDSLTTGYASASFSDKNVGVGKTVNVSGISISGPDAPNYSQNTTATTTANIAPKTLTISGISVNDKVYDGNNTAAINLAGSSLVGVVSGDVVNLSTAGATGTFSDENAAVNKPVVVTGLQLTGTDSGNYTINPVINSSATIFPKNILGSISSSSKVYDGTTSATISGRTLNGVVGADMVNYLGGTAYFSDKNVGTAKTVTATGLYLGGTDSSNYTVNSTAATTANITPRPITVTADPKTKVYGQPDPPLTYQVTSGSLAGSDVITGALTRVAGESTGTYAILKGSLTPGVNYTLTYIGANLTIAQNSAAISLSNLTHAYDGTPKSATVSTTPSGLSYSITYNGSATPPTNAGNYTVSAILTDPSYSGSASGSLVINKANPVITWTNPSDIVYPSALGPAQLNATASVPGTFQYNPAAGTVLSQGNSQTLHADFTPGDSLNYNSASRDVQINVVGPGPIHHYYVSNISSPQTSGTPFNVTIQAQDQNGNNISSGSEAVNISFGETDSEASPVSITTSNGAASFSLILKAVQSAQTVIFIGSTSGKSGTSNSFSVNAAATGGVGGIGGGAPGSSSASGGGGGSSDRIYLSEYMTSGVFNTPFSAKAYDGICNLTIPAGTVAKTSEGWGLSYITIAPILPEKQNLPFPDGGSLIGLTYQLGPDGTTFDPPITINMLYDPAVIPQGVSASDLVIGVWDTSSASWIVLEGCTVDLEKQIITAPVSHFSTYSILGFQPRAPSFTLSQLAISPAALVIGQTATISALVTNSGDTAGDYTANLEIGGMIVDTKSLHVEPKSNQRVSFSTILDSPGRYEIKINDLASQLEVNPALPPESFLLRDLSVPPGKIIEGLKAAISAQVINPNGFEYSGTITLKIDDKEVDNQTISIPPNGQRTIVFEATPGIPGTHTIELGELSATLEVDPAASPASLSISALNISRTQASPGEEITLTVLVTNSGQSPGNYDVILQLNGKILETKTVTVPQNDSRPVIFNVSEENSGVYAADINGLTGTFKIKPEPSWQFPAWTFVLAGLAFILTILFTLWRSRRSRHQVS